MVSSYEGRQMSSCGVPSGLTVFETVASREFRCSESSLLCVAVKCTADTMQADAVPVWAHFNDYPSYDSIVGLLQQGRIEEVFTVYHKCDITTFRIWNCRHVLLQIAEKIAWKGHKALTVSLLDWLQVICRAECFKCTGWCRRADRKWRYSKSV